MKTHSIKSAFAALLFAGASVTAAYAGSSATQTVTYEVQAIDELAVSSSTVALTVNSATAGSAPNSASDSSSSYSITTNETNRKITGQLSSDMPTGVTLSVALAAPTGATTLGAQQLSSSPVDLVTGISTLNETGKTIAYTLAATSAAGVVPSASKTVTLTITAAD